MEGASAQKFLQCGLYGKSGVVDNPTLHCKEAKEEWTCGLQVMMEKTYHCTKAHPPKLQKLRRGRGRVN